MESFEGRVAAITGAGSGIGRALAVQLAGGGRPPGAVRHRRGRAGRDGRPVRGARRQGHLPAARRRRSAWRWTPGPTQVVADHGKVNLIVNNAGVGLAATIEAMSYDDFEWLMGINFWGVVHGTKAFLPHLEAAGEGHVVNLSSVFGLLSIPTQSAYNAAKFGVRGFTDALRMELEIDGAARVGHHRPPRRHQDEHRPQRPHRRLAGGHRRRRGQLRPHRLDHAGEGGPGHPPGGQGRQAPGARRPDAKVLDLVSRLPAGLTQRVMIAGGKRRRS